MKADISNMNVGIGLRRELIDPLRADFPTSLDFLEVAPENWIGVGGKLGKKFRAIAGRSPIFCHGLSLSLGGPAPLNVDLLKKIKGFLKEFEIPVYSEHLSYTGDEGQLYDLLPIPFTEEAVRYVSKRILRTQEILGRRISVENVSYYLRTPLNEMDELSFIRAVLKEADCKLLLDVNNIYVNSVNHRYDPYRFLDGIPKERIEYIHVAGHYRQSEDLLIDTHGADVIDPVWQLLAHAYGRFGIFPTLLERDFQLPPLKQLLGEAAHIGHLQEEAHAHRHAKRA